MYESEIEQAGVEVVGIAQFNTNRAETAKFIETEGLTFKNIYDGDRKLADAYGITGVPAYVFIAPDGRVTGKSVGARGTDYITAQLATLTGGQ